MKTLREYIDLVDGKTLNEFALSKGDEDPNDLTDEAYKDGQRLGFSLVDGATRATGFEASRYLDKYLVPFTYGWNAGREAKIKNAKKDGVDLTLQKDGSLARVQQGLAEADSDDYDYPYNMSARDKGRYDAMTGREYNNPYSAFGTQEDHNNAIEYSAAYDSASEQDVNEDEAQEYTVRVVDEEGSGYTVKVTATSEQGALHKAIVKVRNSGARPEHARIIRQDVEEQATPEAIARIEQLSSK